MSEIRKFEYPLCQEGSWHEGNKLKKIGLNLLKNPELLIYALVD